MFENSSVLLMDSVENSAKVAVGRTAEKREAEQLGENHDR